MRRQQGLGRLNLVPDLQVWASDHVGYPDYGRKDVVTINYQNGTVMFMRASRGWQCKRENIQSLLPCW